MKEITEEVLLSLGFTKKSKNYCKNIGKEKIYLQKRRKILMDR